jgi:hypothetical protein
MSWILERNRPWTWNSKRYWISVEKKNSWISAERGISCTCGRESVRQYVWDEQGLRYTRLSPAQSEMWGPHHSAAEI